MIPQDSEEDRLIRVLVVDDQQLMRDGLATLLHVQPGIVVVGTAANGQQAVKQAMALQPDVVLMDVRMPIMDGVTATAEVLRQVPACQVLMLTTFDDDEYVSGALQAGARGYLLKDLPAHDLAQAIRAAHRGLYQFDPTIGGKIIASLQINHVATQAGGSGAEMGQTDTRPTGLTEREIGVLQLIAQGKTNREIAAQLIVTESTVKSHVTSIFERLQVSDRTQAAFAARDLGLL